MAHDGRGDDTVQTAGGWLAHSGPEGGEPLALHLERTGETAARFAAEMDPRLADWGRTLGRLHDVGKATPDFLKRLAGGPKVEHATAGGLVALRHYGKAIGSLFAFCLIGHHGGLPDCGALEIRMKRDDLPVHDPQAEPDLPRTLDPMAVRPDGFGLGVQIRLLFSCLVDADSLETEAFYHPERAGRRGRLFDAGALLARLDAYLARIEAKANAEAPDSPVNRLRHAVLLRSRAAGRESRPGLFTLDVPTGGGKTLAGLAFALEHAKATGRRRVIVACPYTTIIEQTAQVYRDALGAEEVLEHHSNFRPQTAPLDDDDDRETLRLAEENWDVPIVVTTTVQLFESLFANRRERCRKLHNLAGAVLVLDEAQLLPGELLKPVLAMLKELASHWGVSVVLTTATQPALIRSDWLPCGMDGVTPIIGPPEETPPLYATLKKRVAITVAGPMDDTALAAALADTPQGMVVVNTRDHARALFERIADLPGAAHLSALMCPAHRARVLIGLRADLKAGRPVRLATTTLVEAGVDISFPAIWRAMAGLDSILQAAGRCNREGTGPLGRVTVFDVEDARQLPEWSRRAALTRQALARFADPQDRAAVEWFFRELYRMEDLDRNGILPLLTTDLRRTDLAFRFASAADAFRMIKDDSEEVIVPWSAEAEALIERLRTPDPSLALHRALQPFTVPIRPAHRAALRASGAVETLHGRFTVLVERNCYDGKLGLQP